MQSEKGSLFTKNGKVCDFSVDELMKTFTVSEQMRTMDPSKSQSKPTHATTTEEDSKNPAIDRF